MGTELFDTLQRALGDAYVVERELTRGGMSQVFLATEAALGRKVVIKVLSPDLTQSVSIERFRREIGVAAQLAHPHIVGVLTAGQAHGIAYYTMPFVEGNSLRSRLTDGEPIPVDDVLQLLRGVALALAYAHERGVVHRDIKPDNVLLAGGSRTGGPGTAMVTDFGVAKAISAATDGATSGFLTSTGISLGTPAYMAPEQVAAEPDIDHRADIYAFGTMAYELLAGAVPFAGRSAAAVLSAQVIEAPTPVEVRRPDIPAELAALVGRCIAKARDDRPASAAEIVDVIDGIIAGDSRAPTSGGMRARTPARTHASEAPTWVSRRPVALALAAAVVLASAGSVAWWWATRAAVASGSAPAAGPADSAGKSIAVLPLENIGDSTNAYFAAGMTDEIVTMLGRIPGLRIASRTSTRALSNRRNATIPQIGQALRVSSVLEGTVRRDGQRVRVRANLVNVANGESLWSESFDGRVTDVFQLQDSMAHAIARRLALTLGGPAKTALASRSTQSVVAQDLLWQARYAGVRISEHDLRAAIALYDSAIKVDPDYAEAYVGKAYSWIILADDFLRPDVAYPQAEAALKKALEIDPRNASAHATYGLLRWWYGWDADTGEREIFRGVTLDPDNVRVLVLYGTLLGHTHRPDAAIAQLKRAVTLDSLSANANNQLALGYLYSGRYHAALTQAKKTVDLFPATGTSTYAKALRSLGRYDEAATTFRKSNELGYRSARGEEGITLAMAGKRDSALAIARELERERKQSYVAADLIGRIYLSAGDLDAGFRWLDTAYAEHSGYLMQLDVKDEYAPFRKDPRFVALRQRVATFAATHPR